MKELNNYLQFMPDEMVKHLVRKNDGTVCYDRETMVDDANKLRDFYYIINGYYQVKWSCAEHITVYFETDGSESIYGGCYNLLTGEKVSKRKLVSSSLSTPYTYTQKAIQNMINRIDRT